MSSVLIQHEFVSKATQMNQQNQMVELTKFTVVKIFDWLVLTLTR